MVQETNINNNGESIQSERKNNTENLESLTLSESKSKPHLPMGRTGPLVAILPVVLSNPEIRIEVESRIKLQDEAVEIRTINKHIFLTECKVIPGTEQLFIEGYVQKNIQFLANKTSTGGNLQYTTYKIPFKCVSKIHFSIKPVYGYEDKKRAVSKADNNLSRKNNEDTWIHFRTYGELVRCELESTKIVETDIYENRAAIKEDNECDEAIEGLVSKMVMYIQLLVVQNQKVFIPEPTEDVILAEKPLRKNDSEDIKGIDDKYPNIIVGYDAKKGMVAKEI